MKPIIGLALVAFGALLAVVVVFTAGAATPADHVVPAGQVFNGDLTIKSPAPVVRSGDFAVLFGGQS